jgi:hypothetical protein
VYTKNEFLPQEPFLRFSQRTCPIHYFRSKTHVWGGFAQFRCRTSHIPKTGCRGAYKARVFATGTISLFFATNLPNPLLYVQNSCLGWFRAISLSHITHSETGVGCIQSSSFCHRNHFFVFRNELAQSTTLGPKLMFGVVSRNFVVARHTFLKRVVGVHTKHEFLPPEPFLRFLQRTCPIH